MQTGTGSGKTQTREIGPLSMRADLVPGSINEENRTVDLIWTTGARVMRGFFDQYLEELSLDPAHVRMGRLDNGAPLLDAHNGRSNDGVIGVVESAQLGKKAGTATVRFAKDDAAADSIWSKVKQGIIRNVSVGYRVYRLEATGEQVGDIPVRRATDWEPMEISMVPIGADSGSTVRSDAEHANTCVFVETAIEERAMKTDKKTETIVPAVAATPAPLAIDIDAIRAEAQVAERTRSAAIQRITATLDLGDFSRSHLDDNTSAEEYQRIAFDEFEKRKTSHVSEGARPNIQAGEDQKDKNQRALTGWLITRSGQASKVLEGAKKRGETLDLDPGHFRGMTLMDIARASLEAAGVSTRGMSKMELAGKALTHRAGMATTSDFPVGLEVAIHKMMLGGYGTTPDTWSRICKRGSVGDFLAHGRFRPGSFGVLDTVAEGGEFKNKAIADAEKESITAATKGNLVTLSRQAIINDDMGMFADMAQAVGRSAGLSIESDFYALLALNAGLGPAMNDGDTLFHANHSNLGAGAAISGAALDANAAIMAAQTDPSGNEILDIEPNVLLLARGLKATAITLNDSQYDVDNSSKKSTSPNVVAGLFGDIVASARLTGTRRYLFADPSIYPVVEVVFLDGQEEPYLEARQGWSVDGVEWKVRLDYKVGAIDFRGALTDAGA